MEQSKLPSPAGQARAERGARVDELLVERSDEGVVTLTLNRPRRKNAVPPHGWEELRRVFHDVQQRP